MQCDTLNKHEYTSRLDFQYGMYNSSKFQVVQETGFKRPTIVEFISLVPTRLSLVPISYRGLNISSNLLSVAKYMFFLDWLSVSWTSFSLVHRS